MKKYISLLLLYSFIVETITGIVLYVMPHGSTAYWINWAFLGLDKTQWDDLHIIFGFLLIFFGIWHTVLNWNSIICYIKSKKDVFISKPFAISTALSALLCAGTVMGIPPFKKVIEIGNDFKAMWAKGELKPPAPHAEMYPLIKIAELLEIPPTRAAGFLNYKGIKVVSLYQNLKEIADMNSVRPVDIYKTLVEISPKGPVQIASSCPELADNIGEETISSLAKKLNMSEEEIIRKLSLVGIKANRDHTLKQIAINYNTAPSVILSIIHSKGGCSGCSGCN
ncbi:DUF4405 domain-containing protein [Desulfurobacterium atlanticum]|uniref:Flavinylation-associated cytochrome domain-containing protein n=1 Tax=Desulfurobacterium atlanticum TaxID=240169 RepID=A0A238ZWF8_9BACT|nr:translation initiation factor IF-2 N-terminal domain-containing protein [Desulfurobacterium atlanticum]SNR86993.1 protein of unknown function [Desulfurobacterium atlanticum]